MDVVEEGKIKVTEGFVVAVESSYFEDLTFLCYQKRQNGP